MIGDDNASCRGTFFFSFPLHLELRSSFAGFLAWGRNQKKNSMTTMTTTELAESFYSILDTLSELKSEFDFQSRV